jgi:Ca2+-binding RTX toxin-like protein
MRRAVLLGVVAAMVMALAAGTVLAESKTCAALECVGTREADTLTGSSDAQEQGRIAGLEGNDQIDGDAGNDALHGDEGNDTIYVDDFDGAFGADTVNCGPGTKDKVVFDRGLDTIHKSCEIKIAG